MNKFGSHEHDFNRATALIKSCHDEYRVLEYIIIFYVKAVTTYTVRILNSGVIT